MDKTCIACKVLKPVEDFGKCGGFKSGVNSRCKACINAYYRQRRIDKYDEVRGYEKKFHAERRLRYEYGTTAETIEQAKANQSYACAICKATVPLVIDHCHSKGKGHFRGLLCSPCNLGLGHFKDNKENLRKAIEYLERT